MDQHLFTRNQVAKSGTMSPQITDNVESVTDGDFFIFFDVFLHLFVIFFFFFVQKMLMLLGFLP